LASKPVMEGKSVLFKRFADIDAIDIEVDTEDADEFINCVRYLGPTWGGINLEDIKAPDCFIIEQKLREVMDIPVFHDDQHGTAIITTAGLLNAAHITGRKMKDIKLVVLGAGSAGIACTELAKVIGVREIYLVDRLGIIYEGREDGMNQWKSAHAIKTDKRTLADALDGADAFFGLAGKDTVTKEMVIDSSTRNNLELLSTLSGEYKGSLLSVINRTVTSAGARLLHGYMGAPLLNPEAILRRHKMVQFFYDNEEVREKLQHIFKRLPDIERSLSRLYLRRGGPRDLAAIREGLKVALDVSGLLEFNKKDNMPDGLVSYTQQMGSHDDVRSLLDESLEHEVPFHARDGGFIREGFDAKHIQRFARSHTIYISFLQHRNNL